MSQLSRPCVGVTVGAADARSFDASYGDYFEALELVGLDWVVLSPKSKAVPIPVSRLDGLLLTGGGDIAPARYGQCTRAKLVSVDDARDAFELTTADAAISCGLPVFGICRGLQLLNVLMGGTLFQDLCSEVDSVTNHRQKARAEGVHWVQTVGERALVEGCGNHIWVNSRHHQAVNHIGKGLSVAALADDGIVEALRESAGASWILGVQWHPENMAATDGNARALFEAFSYQCDLAVGGAKEC